MIIQSVSLNSLRKLFHIISRGLFRTCVETMNQVNICGQLLSGISEIIIYMSVFYSFAAGLIYSHSAYLTFNLNLIYCIFPSASLAIIIAVTVLAVFPCCDVFQPRTYTIKHTIRMHAVKIYTSAAADSRCAQSLHLAAALFLLFILLDFAGKTTTLCRSLCRCRLAA